MRACAAARTTSFPPRHGRREVRNFLEKAITNHATRVVSIKEPTEEQLCTIILDDVKDIVPNVIEKQ